MIHGFWWLLGVVEHTRGVYDQVRTALRTDLASGGRRTPDLRLAAEEPGQLVGRRRGLRHLDG
jgi:hypothetical protein